jgi:MYXO-CTERM domain-containing protein
MRADRIGRCALWFSLVLWLAPSQASAFCRLTTAMAVAGKTCTTAGNPLFWPRQCIQYSVAERDVAEPAYEDIRQVVDESFLTWLEADCNGEALPMQLIQTDAPSTCHKPQYNDAEPNLNSIIFVRDWAARKLPAEAFGLTLVWHRKQSGRIVDADMQLNETLGTLGLCGDRCEPGVVDMQNIITHEAGHFLGLGHSSELDASMYGKATVGETSKRHLNNDDIAGICAIYGDLEAPTCSEADFEPDNGQGTECYIEPYERSCDCGVVGAPYHSARAAFAWLALCGVFAWRRRRANRTFT